MAIGKQTIIAKQKIIRLVQYYFPMWFIATDDKKIKMKFYDQYIN